MGVDFRLIREKQEAARKKHEDARKQTPNDWLLFMDNMVADIGRYNAEMAKANKVIKRIDAEIATLLKVEPDV